jgi:hypothetical protein
MEFKEQIKKLCRVKYVIIFCLFLLFLWWGSNAVLRYWSQPLSTDISYNYGDTKRGIQFPLITLCNDLNTALNDPMIKECRDGSWSFISILISCMKIDKTYHTHNFHPETSNIIEKVQLWTGSEYVNLHNFYGKVWTKIFHNMYGPCYTFDLSKVDKFKYILLKAGQKPGIEFVMAEKNPWKDATVMLHTKFDLPDAFQLNGRITLSFSDQTPKAHR